MKHQLKKSHETPSGQVSERDRSAVPLEGNIKSFPGSGVISLMEFKDCVSS